MRFSKENMGQYNMMKVKEVLKCSICNEDTNYIDYFNSNKFCSTECQEKYYKWMKKNKESIA